jgi:hypothetical protein
MSPFVIQALMRLHQKQGDTMKAIPASALTILSLFLLFSMNPSAVKAEQCNSAGSNQSSNANKDSSDSCTLNGETYRKGDPGFEHCQSCQKQSQMPGTAGNMSTNSPNETNTTDYSKEPNTG